MVTEEVLSKAKQIKKMFRLRMNGDASRSMRDKGVVYHLNWGVSLTDLKQIAEPYVGDYELAVCLWADNVRECKIIASIIMPAEKIDRELCDKWVSEIETVELAEVVSKFLFSRLPFARQLATRWIAASGPYVRMCGFQVLSSVISHEEEAGAEDEQIINLAIANIENEHLFVRKSCLTFLTRYAEKSQSCENMVKRATQSANLEIFL